MIRATLASVNGLVLTATVLTAAVVQASVRPASYQARIIRINGVIDSRAVAKIYTMLAGAAGRPYKGLVITSIGGDAIAAMRLGTLVHQYGISVIVSDYCMSACSEYVLAAGRSRFVEPNSVILFHSSPVLLYDEYRRASMTKEAQIFFDGKVTAARLYRDAHVDFSLFRAALIGLQPSCLYFSKNNSRDVKSRYQLQTKVAAFGIAPAILDAAGMRVSGDVPSNLVEIITRLRRLGFSRLPPISFVTPKLNQTGSTALTALANQSYATLPICARN